MDGQVPDPAEFWAALAKASPEEVAAALQKAGLLSPEQLRQLKELVASAQSPDHQPQGPAPTVDAPAREEVGAQIGPYRLLQELGEGGMGTVFLAEQQHPVERRVALKIIKAGMDSRQVLARFEAEEQALAMMDHPNIAKVFDAGVTQAGRPYFVMELVKGIPITQYCDQEHLTPRERLELFIPVCQAVQHAHQKGIIHRDLKPSNVIVALYDGKPVPKVIDFGVAKATGAKLTERTMFTEVGQMVGTLEYMAPEQAELNNLDIDTRADIYSLGVLLYELLTGSPPFSSRELRSAAFDEMLRIIREVEPPKPSTKLSSSDELPAIAAKRKLEPQRLTKLVSGELDWIVMKCLEKERARRYETANGLAADVEHYLHDEPVQAGPPSRAYRLKKLVRRNKVAITTAGVVALSLVAGMCGTTWQAIRAMRAESLAEARYEGERTARSEAEAERNRANEQSQRADAEAARAKQEEEKARSEAAVAQAVRGFLQDKLLGQADIRTQADALLRLGHAATRARPDLTVREMLDRAAEELTPEKINENFPNQYLVQASLLGTIGATYVSLGMYDLALGPLQRAVQLFEEHAGPNDSGTLAALSSLALAYGKSGRLTDAIHLFERICTVDEKKYVPNDAERIVRIRLLAQTYLDAGRVRDAVDLLERNHARLQTVCGMEHGETLRTANDLGLAYALAGRLPEAIKLLDQVRVIQERTLGRNHPDVQTTSNNLALAYLEQDRPSEAMQLLQRVRLFNEAKLGPEHPDTLITLDNFAQALLETGQMPAAIELHKKVLDIRERTLGPEHPDTLTTLNNLGGAYVRADRVAEAIDLMEHGRTNIEKALQREHPLYLKYLNNLAVAYGAAHRLNDEIGLYEQVLGIQETTLGEDHPDTLRTISNLASAYRETGMQRQAIQLLERVRPKFELILGSDHQLTLQALGDLGYAYWSVKQYNESISLYEEVVRRTGLKLGRQHPNTLQAIANLGVNLEDAGHIAEALPLLKEAYNAHYEIPGLQWVGKHLLDAYAKLGQTADATALVQELLISLRQSVPTDSPQFAGQLARFGAALVQVNAFAEAESVLRECLNLREKSFADDWRTFHTTSVLGVSLLGQAKQLQGTDARAAATAKFTEAEPLLVQGYEGMQKRADAIPADVRTIRLTEALQRLVDLYTAWGKPDEAAKWQQKLEEAKAAAEPHSGDVQQAEQNAGGEPGEKK